MKTLDYIHLDASAVSNVVASLKQLLADYQVFYTNLRGFHWNIKGHGFFVLHGKFEDMYNNAAEKVDELAERILMLGGEPENKFSEYLKVARVKEDSLRLEKVGSDSGLFLLVPIGVFYCFMSYSYISFDYFIKIKSI